MQTYNVRIYYTGFCAHEITAKTEDEAILIARRMDVDKDEILSNLEGWKDADTAEVIT